MQIRAFLADDEQAARARLRKLLDHRPAIQIVGEATNVLEAVEMIERLQPELIFLDVQMPGLNGFEILKGLSKEIPRPLTIFVTGFHEYALEAFRERAVAYLLKPIEEAHLREMIDRVGRLLTSTPFREEENRSVDRLLDDQPRPMEQIVARKANRVFLLDPADALLFYMDNGIVRVHVENDTYWVNYQLGELEDALASKGFFRARRSALVNLRRVKEIRSDPRSFVLVMDDAKTSEVEVSERQARALRARIPGL
ncbi:MAG TPA: LytTR family DNA-binding domain-containing protein [Bryobacteraceae bacterium]|nr:LytTR family DNA-binding domain-containing protein [Bryobacteraceae bacterium]